MELKIGEFAARYKSQMKLCLKWLNRHERQDGEQAHAELGPGMPIIGVMDGGGETSVRAAVLSDAEGIARTHVDSWRETYSGVLDDRSFSEDSYARRLDFWRGCLSLKPQPGRLAVAVRDGTVVGFAHAGEAVGPDAEHGFAPARSLHLFSIYLLASRHGTSAGQALLDAVVGDEPAQLWVLRGNARAISFYQRNGFAADGAEYSDPSRTNMVELRMVR